MNQVLEALLIDLERRCLEVANRLQCVPTEPDLAQHLLLAYRDVETVRRNAANLLVDPTLLAPTLIDTHFRTYKRLAERAGLVEKFALPVAERYNNADRKATRLCRELITEAGWPLPVPVIAMFSHQYYWTVVEFNIICMPAAETVTLLGIPDLCHELGHHLWQAHSASLVGTFLVDLATYIISEKQKVGQNRSSHYITDCDALFAHWVSVGVIEFVCDMVATFLSGEAFGYQHVRLCSNTSNGAYAPALPDMLGQPSHPADEARLRGIEATLKYMGMNAEAGSVRDMWNAYMGWTGEIKPQEYDVCYPQSLIDSLAKSTVDGCRMLGIRGIDQVDRAADDIQNLMRLAWDRWISDPKTASPWEANKLAELWRNYGI